MGKKRSESLKKNIFQISHLIFWMLQAAKYLNYDFTFTSSFFFSSGGPFFIYMEYLDAKKMMDKFEISIWNMKQLP